VFTDPLVQSCSCDLPHLLVVTALAVIAAYAIAYVWVRGTPGQRRFAEFLHPVPFWISVLTRAFGWVALLSNRGLIKTLAAGGGRHRRALTLVRNEFGVVVGYDAFPHPLRRVPAGARRCATSDERRVFGASAGQAESPGPRGRDGRRADAGGASPR